MDGQPDSDIRHLHARSKQSASTNRSKFDGQPPSPWSTNQSNKQTIDRVGSNKPTNLSTIRSVTPPTNQSTRVINRRVLTNTRSRVDNEDQGLDQSTNGSTNQSTSQSINQSMSYQSINQLTNQSIIEHSSSQTMASGSGRRSLKVVRKITQAHQTINHQSTNQLANQPTSQSVVQPTSHSSIRSTSSVVRPGKRVYSDNEADDRPTNRMRRETNESIDQSVDQSVDQSKESGRSTPDRKNAQAGSIRRRQSDSAKPDRVLDRIRYYPRRIRSDCRSISLLFSFDYL